MVKLKDIKDFVDEKAKCLSCNRKLHGTQVRSYDHEGGVELEGFGKKQWVYAECSCGIQSALEKLLKAFNK